MNNTSQQIEEVKEVSLKELILNSIKWVEYLKSKWIFILLAGIIGAAFGFYYAYKQKPTYEAALSFVLEEGSASTEGGLNGLASQFGFGSQGGGGAFSGQNLFEFMKSRTILEKTLLSPVYVNNTKISLAEFYINFNGLRTDWEVKKINDKLQFPPDADRSKFTLEQDSTLGVIYRDISNNYLKIDQLDKKVTIFSITVKSMNELFSKFFVEALVLNVSNYYIETKSKKAKINVEIIEKQVDSVRRELNAALAGVAIANDDIFNLNPALNIKRLPSSRRQIDVQTNATILTQLIANLESSKITLRRETPLIQVIDGPMLPLKKERPGKLRSMIWMGFLFGFFTILFFILKRIKTRIFS